MTDSSVTPAGAAPQVTRPESSIRAVAMYLAALRAFLKNANEAHQVFIRALGLLLQDARNNEPNTAVQARRVGADQSAIFRALRHQLDQIPTPGVCEACHAAVVGWIDKQLAACDVLDEVATTNDVTKLRAAQGLLAEARQDQRRFTADYQQLVEVVRTRADAARKSRQAKKVKRGWPFR